MLINDKVVVLAVVSLVEDFKLSHDPIAVEVMSRANLNGEIRVAVLGSS